MLGEATYLKPAVMPGSETIQVQNPPPHFLSTVNDLPNSKMSYSRRPKAEGRRERLSSASNAPSGAREVESTEVTSNETDPTINSEMFITKAVDEDCDMDMIMIPKLRMQHGSEDSEKGPFVERNPDEVVSTLEWRGKTVLSQKGYQATASSSRLQQTAEERWRSSLEAKIEQIRREYQEQESILEREIVKLEQGYESVLEQLEKEENDGEYYSITERWGIQSDYQPTECGDDA